MKITLKLCQGINNLFIMSVQDMDVKNRFFVLS